MKMRRARQPRRYPPLSLRRGVILYFLLLFLCLIFTQALYSLVSSVILIFVLLLPIGDVLLLVLAYRSVTVTAEAERSVISRGDRLSFSVCLHNCGLIPIAQCEVTVRVPRRDERGYEWHAASVTVPSFSTCRVAFDAPHAIRGVYQVGSEELYLSDLLHLIRVRKRIGHEVEIRVLPCRGVSCGALPSAEGVTASTDLIERSVHADYGDVREYRPGDFMKSIHWKLSSKNEELQVRKRAADVGRTTVIVCDLFSGEENPFGISPRHSILSDDLVTEDVWAVACEIAVGGVDGYVFMAIGEEMHAAHFFDAPSAEVLAEPLAEASGAVSIASLGHLMASLPSVEEVAVVYVTAFLSPSCEERLLQAYRDMGGRAFCVYLCDRKELLSPALWDTYEKERDALCLRLASQGIPVQVVYRKEERR